MKDRRFVRQRVLLSTSLPQGGGSGLLTRPSRNCFLEAFSFESDSGPRSLSVRYAQPGMAVPPVHVRVVQTSNEQARPKEAGSLVRTLT